MFKKILRIKSRRVIALWVVLMLALPLILFFHWGVGGSGAGPGAAAGVIFGRPIPQERYEQEFREVRRRLVDQLGGTVPEDVESLVRQQTWDRLILVEEARRRARVENEEVARTIQSHATFQREGRFDPTLYFRFVRAIGSSPQTFEARLRDDLRIQKLLDLIRSQVDIPEDGLKAAYAQEAKRLQATLITIEPARFVDTARQALTDDELRQSYALHQETLRRPSQRIIEYVGLSLAEAIRLEPAISEEELRTSYEEQPEAFAAEGGSPRPFEEAREVVRQRLLEDRARRRLTRLALDLELDREEGLRFVEIALARTLLAHKVGPVDRASGDLPNGPTAAMWQEVLEGPLGQMSRVFDTPAGVFLLIPIEELPSRLPSFEEVRDELTRRRIRERSLEASRARADQLHAELLALRQRGLTFEETCLVLGVQGVWLAPTTRRALEESLGYPPAVTERLFALNPGELSEVLETPEGFVTAFIEDQFPFDEAQFVRERDRFRQTLLASRQEEHLTTWFESLRSQARLKDYLNQPAVSP